MRWCQIAHEAEGVGTRRQRTESDCFIVSDSNDRVQPPLTHNRILVPHPSIASFTVRLV